MSTARKEYSNIAKTYNIFKELVWKAYLRGKANGGSAGIDAQSIGSFEEHQKDNLYKLWQRLSSCTYFPPPVKEVLILKKAGDSLILGVLTMVDRVAHTAAKMILETSLELLFHDDS